MIRAMFFGAVLLYSLSANAQCVQTSIQPQKADLEDQNSKNTIYGQKIRFIPEPILELELIPKDHSKRVTAPPEFRRIPNQWSVIINPAN